MLAVDGRWGKDTQRAFERVCAVLGVKPERTMRVFRIIAGALAARTGAELEQASMAYERSSPEAAPTDFRKTADVFSRI